MIKEKNKTESQLQAERLKAARDADFTARMNDYARSVALTGRDPKSGLVQCGFVIGACRRHIADLDRQGAPDFPFTLCAQKIGAVCRFAEEMPHTKGPLIREKLRLQDWQVFILGSVFGWRRENGARRFTEMYLEIARKNGKSKILSIILLYCAIYEEPHGGAEALAAAASRDQAKIVLGETLTMINMCPTLKKLKKIVRYRDKAEILGTGIPSVIQAVASDAKNLDGKNPSCVVIDEYHAHPTSDVYDVMSSAQGARQNPLLAVITTAGFILEGPCHIKRRYAEKVINSVFRDDRLFAIIFTIDDGDDWRDADNLHKANPNLGVSVDRGWLTDQLTQAKNSLSRQRNFKTKHLCVWCSGQKSWLDITTWNKCAASFRSPDGEAVPLTLETVSLIWNEWDFEKREPMYPDKRYPCVIAYDLSSKCDFTAKVYHFKGPDGRHYVIPAVYYPAAASEERIQKFSIPLADWMDAGLITPTPGNVIDIETVVNDAAEDLRRFDVKQIPYDAWNATFFVQAVQKLVPDAPFLQVPQKVWTFSEPMKEIEALVIRGQVVHPDHPVFNWMMSNVVVKEDHNGNIFPRKEKNTTSKIDLCVCMIMCFAVEKVSRPVQAVVNPLALRNFAEE